MDKFCARSPAKHQTRAKEFYPNPRPVLASRFLFLISGLIAPGSGSPPLPGAWAFAQKNGPNCLRFEVQNILYPPSLISRITLSHHQRSEIENEIHRRYLRIARSPSPVSSQALSHTLGRPRNFQQPPADDHVKERNCSQLLPPMDNPISTILSRGKMPQQPKRNLRLSEGMPSATKRLPHCKGEDLNQCKRGNMSRGEVGLLVRRVYI